MPAPEFTLNTSSLPVLPDATLRTFEKLSAREDTWGPGGVPLAYTLAALSGLGAGARVLDAGGGSGDSACFLAAHFGWQVTVLDTSHDALVMARQKVKTRGLHAQVFPTQGSMLAPPFGAGQFDGVIVLDALEMLGEARREAVQTLARLLRPGGLLLLGEPVLSRAMDQAERRVAHGNDFAARFWTLEAHRGVMEAAGLRVTTLEPHPASAELWEAFVSPWFGPDGQLLRPEVQEVAYGWRRDGGRTVGVGVMVAHKPS